MQNTEDDLLSLTAPAMLDAIDHPATLLDLSGVVRFVNRAWTKHAGDNAHDGSDFIGVNYFEVCGTTPGAERGDADDVLKGLQELAAGKRNAFAHTYPCHAPSQRRWYKAMASRVGDAILVIHIDVTKDYEALPPHVLTHHYAQLAHDLMNPLNALVGFLSLVKDGMANLKDATRLRGHVDWAVTAANSLQEMFVEMMSTGRQELEEHQTRTAADAEPIAISSLVQEIASTQRASAAHLWFDFDDCLPSDVRLKGSTLQVRRIVQNLISNAIKYNRPDGIVSVSLELNRSKGVELRVVDSGVGIAKDDLPRIFDKYQQVGHGKEQQNGFGIGLGVAKDFVTAHEGSIEVTSTLGAGTTFTVSFPAWRTLWLKPATDAV